MKNAMKRIMGLLLVAVLLVSVVPFQALADTGDKITFQVKENDSDDVNYTVERASKNGEVTIKAMLDNWYKQPYESIKSVVVDGTTYKSGDIGDIGGIVVADGSRVTVRVTTAAPTTQPTTKPAETTTAPTEASKNELIRFQIKLDDSDEVTYTKIATPEGKTATVKNLLTYWFKSDWSNNYTFKHAYSVNDGKTYTDINTAISVGDTVTIRLTCKNTSTTPTTPSTTKQPITVEVKVNKSSNIVKTFTKVPNGDTAKIGDLLAYGWKENWKNSYDFDHAYCNKTTLYSMNDTVKAGDTVSVLLKTKGTTVDPGVADEDDVTVKYYVNGKLDQTKIFKDVDQITVRTLIKEGNYDLDDYNNVTAQVGNNGKGLNSAIAAGETVKIYLRNESTNVKTETYVYLDIYLNRDFDTYDRRIRINTDPYDLTDDDRISLKEVENLLSDRFYKAKSSKGITYDGLYLAKGNWLGDWTKDEKKYEYIDGITQKAADEGTVVINVMLTNATRKTSSTADSSNPKTGDAIFMTITVMGLSAAGLTAVYFYDKKRKAL